MTDTPATPPAKPGHTPGALRAAMKLVTAARIHWFSLDEERAAYAEIIDEETDAPDLLEALECLVHRCDAEGVGVAWAPLTAARAALAKAGRDE